MDDVIAEGDVVPVKVTFVNHAFFRLNVSYREARSDTSAGGSWVFDQRGRVMQIPAEASEAFPTSVPAIEARYAARRELSIRPLLMPEGPTPPTSQPGHSSHEGLTG